MKRKNVILTMLVILGMVTFLDRINISVAGSSIMHDLNLSPSEWGWVQSAFILSYGLMQIPMGALGDRFGHRKILSLIVLWWSLFTAFTGLAGGLASLLVIRFMFGIGEAGSSPCSTGVISRWFGRNEVGIRRHPCDGVGRMALRLLSLRCAGHCLGRRLVWVL